LVVLLAVLAGSKSDVESAAPAGDIQAVATDLDAFWHNTFLAADMDYVPAAGVVAVDPAVESACGEHDESDGPASYCLLDQTIYYSPAWRRIIEEETGLLGWGAVMAHEWGHHVQGQLGIWKGVAPGLGIGVYSIDLELQADCLGGTYIRDVEAQGWIEGDDVRDAATLTRLFGDRPGSAWDDPEAHGTGPQRVRAFTRGYEDGPPGCGLTTLDAE
ncbi:MAG: neutral zinc metallopeptidase, partial [Chloroflexota bacterium]|nr:neutral zinc metallopeptidase [Chloroflexota bacterium]